jgi:hypothetical protein
MDIKIKKYDTFEIPKSKASVIFTTTEDGIIYEVSLANLYSQLVLLDQDFKDFISKRHKELETPESVYNLLEDIGIGHNKLIEQYFKHLDKEQEDKLLPIPEKVYPSVQRLYLETATMQDLILIYRTFSKGNYPSPDLNMPDDFEDGQGY